MTPDHHSASTINEETLVRNSDSATSDHTDNNIVTKSFTHYEPIMPPKSTASFEKPGSNTSQLASNAGPSEHPAGNIAKSQELGTVAHFARVNTGTAVFEIGLDDIQIKNKDLDNDLLRYAAWKEKQGEKFESVSFEMWVSIIKSSL